LRSIAALIVVLALAAVAWLTWQQNRAEPFVVSGFIEADDVRAGSRVGGRVAEVLAREGQTVAAGDVLLRLEPFDLMQRLAQARAQLAVAVAERDRLRAGFRPEELQQARARRDRAAAVLDKLKTGPRPGEIAIAREELNAADANLELAEAEFQRVRDLYQSRETAQLEFDRAQRERKAALAARAAAAERLALLEQGTRAEEIAEAAAQLAEATAAVALIEAGYRSEDVAQATAQAQAAEAAVAAIEAQVAELTIESPCHCVVDVLEIQPGDLAAPNAPVVALLDLSRLRVRAFVPEARLGGIQLGDRVPISVDSFAGERFAAHITFVAHEAEFTPRNVQTPEERSRQVFRIELTLDEGHERLRPGMAADVWLDERPAP